MSESKCPNCGWQSVEQVAGITALDAMERDRDHLLDLLWLAMLRECEWQPTQAEFEQWCRDLWVSPANERPICSHG